MKKIYSFVLMATMLLIGTNAWAADKVAKIGSTEYETLEAAWAAVEDGQTIELISDATLNSPLWLGTATMEDSIHTKSITLELNGWKIEGKATVERMFFITHGELIVTSSKANGRIQHLGTKDNQSKWEIFRITGSTYKTVNPRTAKNGYFSHLVIGENVNLDARTIGLTLDQNAGWPSTEVNSTKVIATKGVTAPTTLYNTKIYDQRTGVSKTSNYGSAYGVRVDVYGKIEAYKYAIKANGNLGSPISSTYHARTPIDKASPDDASGSYEVLDADTAYTPYIRLYGTSDLRVPKNSDETKKPTSVYASGYARWLIEGTCIGSTAVYVKSGTLDIHDATIHSNYDGDYTAAKPQEGSGVTAQGSAIAIESSVAYAGDIDITISGDTHVSATNGYAIDEAVNLPAGETKVDAITITGGTFEGGDVRTTEEKAQPGSQPVYGTMVVTDVTAELAHKTDTVAITIIGGSSSNGTDSIGNQSLADYLADTQETTTHITYVENEQGKTVMVISEGEGPSAAETKTAWTAIADFTEGSDANWTGTGDTKGVGVIANGETVKLGELQILAATATEKQELTIQDGGALEVKHLMMNKYAKITVEAGGKLIVTGEQGMIAPSANNLVVKTQENKPGIFLFNPAVKSNRNPKATVEFTSKSHVGATKNIYQRFGLPMKKGGLESISGEGNPETRFYVYDLDADKWVGIGYINPSPGYESQPLDYDKLNDPFEYYQMMNFDATSASGVVYTMVGSLLGNTEPTMNILENSWKGFANSYMGKVKLSVLLQLIPNTVDKAIYTYNVNATYASWNPVTNLNSANATLNPMQPFLIRNRYDAADVQLDYEHAVYNPTVGIANPAPFHAPRQNTIDMTMATILVAGELSADQIIVAEGEDFTAEFDNGYDAAKFMNDGINMYVSADEKMSNYATNDLENTYVGFQAVEGGVYTINFANVQGEELTLIDLETGARVAMVEGNAYEFTANGANDYRFQISKISKVATDIENTEAVKSANGIYTITGQYMGEMNVWNSLPAGVYVVNGEKRVK